MMQQYRELKARDPDALLLFRMGDFYEMFGEDAERASALLGLALTTRDGQGARTPCRWPGSPTPRSSRTWPGSSRPASARRSASRSKTPSSPRGSSSATSSGSSRRAPSPTRPARPRGNYLAAVVEVRRQARAGLGRALHRPVLADRASARTELADEIARLDPAETLSPRLQPRRPLGPRPPGRRRAGRHDPPVVGLPARAGPQDALRALRHDHPRRLRGRRRRPRGPGRRGPGRLPPRDAEGRRSATSPG